MIASLIATGISFSFSDWDLGQMSQRNEVSPCFQIEYTLPNQKVDNNFYIYYDGEEDLIEGPQNHIYYNSETGKYYRFIE